MTASTKSGLDSRFAEALQGEDELGVVVRGHIHIESKLNTYIATVVPHPKELPNLRYYQKIELACAMGLSLVHAPLLKAVGDVRNAFAHNPEAQITSQSAAKLRGVFSAIHREAADVVVDALRKSGAELSGRTFGSLSPRDQFTVVAIQLNGMLDAAITQARQSQDTPRRRKEQLFSTLDSFVKRLT